MRRDPALSCGASNPQAETAALNPQAPMAALKHLASHPTRFREIFNLVDLDKGGTISKDELKQLMNTLGLKPSQVSRFRSSVPVAMLPSI